ncbi:unnamed protein product [Closterium sp. Naga37s-1]|nr:unnamed protein product [Closterium sp. Naga37s-1]
MTRPATTIAQLMLIRACHSDALRRHSLGTALGLRTRRGRLTGVPAIVVFVPRKVHEAWLLPAQKLPRKLQGPGGYECDVDVVELTNQSSGSSSSSGCAGHVAGHVAGDVAGAVGVAAEVAIIDNPLVEQLRGSGSKFGPGSQIASEEVYGTLGAIVKKTSRSNSSSGGSGSGGSNSRGGMTGGTSSAGGMSGSHGGSSGCLGVGFLATRHVAVDLDQPKQKLFHPLPTSLGPGRFLGSVERALPFASDHAWFGVFANMNPDSFVRTDGAYIPFHEEFDLSVVTTQVAGIGPIGPPRHISLSDDIRSVVGQHVWKVRGRRSTPPTFSLLSLLSPPPSPFPPRLSPLSFLPSPLLSYPLLSLLSYPLLSLLSFPLLSLLSSPLFSSSHPSLSSHAASVSGAVHHDDDSRPLFPLLCLLSPLSSYQVGSASGLTHGTIAAYAVEHSEGDGMSLFTDLLIVSQHGQAFDCEGDSGALVLVLPTVALSPATHCCGCTWPSHCSLTAVVARGHLTAVSLLWLHVAISLQSHCCGCTWPSHCSLTAVVARGHLTAVSLLWLHVAISLQSHCCGCTWPSHCSLTAVVARGHLTADSLLWLHAELKTPADASPHILFMSCLGILRHIPRKKAWVRHSQSVKQQVVFPVTPLPVMAAPHSPHDTILKEAAVYLAD